MSLIKSLSLRICAFLNLFLSKSILLPIKEKILNRGQEHHWFQASLRDSEVKVSMNLHNEKKLCETGNRDYGSLTEHLLGVYKAQSSNSVAT